MSGVDLDGCLIRKLVDDAFVAGAGYEEGIECAKKKGLNSPMV